MKKLYFNRSILLLLFVFLIYPAIQAQVYNGNLNLTTQAQVNTFTYTEITGYLRISGSGITDLTPLSSLTTLGDNLVVYDCDVLINLDGLQNLTSVGEDLKIYNNAALSNLDGLQNLTAVGGNFNISYNPILSNLHGLHNLASVAGNGRPLFRIYSNTVLSSFCGLYTLLSGGGLTIPYTVSGNAVNPTQQEIIDGGPCLGSFPVAVCQDVSVSADQNCTAMVSPAEVDNGSYDPDGDPIIFSLVPAGPYAIGTTPLTFFVTDTAGNSSQCLATITVTAGFTCPGDMAVDIEENADSVMVTVPQPVVWNACGWDTCIWNTNGNALDFDGLNDYAQLPNILPIGSISSTVEFWVKVPLVGTNNLVPGERVGILLGSYDDPFNINFELHAAGQMRYYWNHSELEIFGSTDIRDDQWHHLAYVRDKAAGKLIMYLDGNIETETTNNVGSDVTVTTLHRLGCDNRGSGTPYFHGKMDEMRIWDYARTATDLVNNMHLPLSGNESGLIAYCNFNTGVAGGDNTNPPIATLPDVTGSGFDATLNNFALIGSSSNWVSGAPVSDTCIPAIMTITNDFNNSSDASGIYPVGETTVTWTATDQSGNASQCSHTVTVNATLAAIPLSDWAIYLGILLIISFMVYYIKKGMG